MLETDRRAELRGMFGTIEHRFGHPEYLADVRLDYGRLELFWAHKLESAQEVEKVFGASARSSAALEDATLACG